MSGNIDSIRIPESLFSLEVVVEKLIMPAVVCRFPTIAFRLLDFPTLLIYHVEPYLAETIKKKIDADPYCNVPSQLQELKDKSGYFTLKKGKSCLFKVSYGTLQAHLMNIPLYVMLIDAFPKVPKLLGNCNIPLDDVMARIGDDINQYGLSMPSAHGERGEYKLYNLMGFEIGSITLGYRLLSLGMGLIPHIPDNSVSAYAETKKEPNPVYKRDPFGSVPPIDKVTANNQQRQEAIANNILQSLEAADKNTQVAISEFMPVLEDMDTQTEKEMQTHFRSSGIQTEQPKRKKVRHRQKDNAGIDTFYDVNKEMSDFFATNMACPPPLFYNSEADDVHVYQQNLQQGLTFNEQGLLDVQVATPNYAWTEEQPDEGSSYSDDTIRHEDVLSDSDVEQNVDFKCNKVVYRDSKNVISQKRRIQAQRMMDNQLVQQTTQVARNINQQTNVRQLQQLPLLNALLKEIMFLQGGSLPDTEQTRGTVSTSRSPSTQSRVSQKDKLKREEHLKKLSTPRTLIPKQRETSSPHQICSGQPQPVPKNKSWVRKEFNTALHIPKTKLSYGMTNAQRLRLAKTNPELLKKLEKQDQERIQKSRERTQQKYSQFQYQREAEIGERLMHTSRNSTSQRTSQRELLKFGASVGSPNEPLSETHKNHRRPIPTPRRSLSLKNEQMKEALMKMMDQDTYRNTMEFQPHSENDQQNERRSWHSGSNQAKSGSPKTQSEKNIEVFPLHASYPNDRPNKPLEGPPIANRQSDAPTGMDKTPAFSRTKTLYDHGFPSERQSPSRSHCGRPASHLTDYGQYSEELYPDSDHNDSVSAQNSIAELPFRQKLDHYSDDTNSDQLNVHLQMVEKHSSSDLAGDDGSGSGFETANSHYSNQSEPKWDVNPAVPAAMLSIASMPNPRASIHSPVTAIRPQIPFTGEGLAASSTPTESDIAATQQSTAYIRESQMPTMTETADSSDTGGVLEETGKSSEDLQPDPSPKKKLDRLSSVHTESVSSYTPSKGENMGLELSEGESENNYTESFDDESDESSGPVPVKQMSDLKLAPEARMGYTWGYSR